MRVYLLKSMWIWVDLFSAGMRMTRFLKCRALHPWAKVTDESPKILQDPLCGSMHVVRPSAVLTLVLPMRSSQSSDSARILTYPPFGISWSTNQFMLISVCTSRSCTGRSRGSSTASGLEGASHCIRRFTRAGPFLLDVFPRWSGLVFNRLTFILVSSSLLYSKSSISSTSSSFSS